MEYIKLMRVKHYIKNFLIFLPLFFNKNIFDWLYLSKAVVGFCCFCLVSSAVYILNDINDVEKDRQHPTKCLRPIASGKVPKGNAILLMIVLVVVSCLLTIVGLKQISSLCFLIFYLVINVAYSKGLKNYPLLDIVILTLGFVIRVIYGGFITNINISNWLYLVIIFASLYMGLGKRRNELKYNKFLETRTVLKYYNEGFLDKNMYVSVTLVIVFYALWTMEQANNGLIWTVPLVTFILMKYSYNIEGKSDGDPIEVILHDKVLIGLSVLLAIIVVIFLYM